MQTDRQVNGRAGTQKYMVELRVAFRHFAKTIKVSRFISRYSALYHKT
jgi:hypothetical protein